MKFYGICFFLDSTFRWFMLQKKQFHYNHYPVDLDFYIVNYFYCPAFNLPEKWEEGIGEVIDHSKPKLKQN